MLDFWYSERCTREMKLGACVVTCLIIYVCSSYERLSTTLTVLSLATGAGLHFIRILKNKLTANHPYAQGFHLLFFVLPIICMLYIICNLPDKHILLSAVQALGFTLLGIFVTSIYANRAKRFD